MRNTEKSLLSSKKFDLGDKMNTVTGGMSMEAVKARYQKITKTYNPDINPGESVDASVDSGTVSISMD